MAKREAPAPNTNQADQGEATKPAATILRQEISVGTAQLERPTSGLLLSALSAGLDLGFGPALVAVARSRWPATGEGAALLLAFFYSIGFLIVILGRSELFTEHTTLAILPLLSRQTTIGRVARLWGLVYLGNLAGAMIFARLAISLSSSLHLFTPGAMQAMSDALVGVRGWPMFGSAIAAGWLMGLVSWLVTAARETVAQVLLIVIVTGAIAFFGLHHSVAGTIEALFAVFAGQSSWRPWLRFLLISTAGNIVGGTVLVALLKYGHVTHARQE